MRSGATVQGGRPLHVAQVLRSLDTGGQEVLCERLVRQLDPDRFQSSVISLQGGGWIADRLRERGIPVYCLEAPEGFRPDLVTRLGALLRGIRADVVHCHNRKALLYGGLASYLAPRARLVFTKHGVSFWTDRPTTLLGRLLLRRTRFTIAVSQDIAGPLVTDGWLSPERLRTILNGVDTEEFRPDAERGRSARAALGLDPGQRVIGTVARLSPEKDQASLLRAFARVSYRLPDARLLLVGDGPLRAELEALAGILDVRERTVFAGECREVAGLLNAMDVFTLPSLTEGTSLTLLEAMASGLPVVASAVGGNPEVVTEGVSGYLVPKASPDPLAERLVRVLTGAETARRMGMEGRRTVLQRYSLDAMVHGYGEVYHAVCGGALTSPGPVSSCMVRNTR